MCVKPAVLQSESNVEGRDRRGECKNGIGSGKSISLEK
jgi:hypothetical protein